MDLPALLRVSEAPVNFDFKTQCGMGTLESESITVSLPVIGLRFD